MRRVWEFRIKRFFVGMEWDGVLPPGLRAGVYRAIGSTLRVATARAVDQFEKEFGRSSKKMNYQIEIKEV